jgi:hypothetical protein
MTAGPRRTGLGRPLLLAGLLAAALPAAAAAAPLQVGGNAYTSPSGGGSTSSFLVNLEFGPGLAPAPIDVIACYAGTCRTARVARGGGKGSPTEVQVPFRAKGPALGRRVTVHVAACSPTLGCRALTLRTRVTPPVSPG